MYLFRLMKSLILQSPLQRNSFYKTLCGQRPRSCMVMDTRSSLWRVIQVEKFWPQPARYMYINDVHN